MQTKTMTKETNKLKFLRNAIEDCNHRRKYPCALNSDITYKEVIYHQMSNMEHSGNLEHARNA
jgi:hypothetical protein